MKKDDLPKDYPDARIWVHEIVESDMDMNVFDNANMEPEYRDHLNPYYYIHQQLFDTFDLGDRLREDTPHVFEDGAEENNLDNDIHEDLENLEDLYMEGTCPVYCGSNISIISASIVLINMAVIHSVTNVYVDELLIYLSIVFLPGKNNLPKSHYEANKLIRKLGLNYHVIHTCLGGCVLYQDEYKHLDKCPKPSCGLSRFIVGLDSSPTRVIQHFL